MENLKFESKFKNIKGLFEHTRIAADLQWLNNGFAFLLLWNFVRKSAKTLNDGAWITSAPHFDSTFHLWLGLRQGGWKRPEIT